jgi:hypothetical protein
MKIEGEGGRAENGRWVPVSHRNTSRIRSLPETTLMLSLSMTHRDTRPQVFAGLHRRRHVGQQKDQQPVVRDRLSEQHDPRARQSLARRQRERAVRSPGEDAGELQPLQHPVTDGCLYAAFAAIDVDAEEPASDVPAPGAGHIVVYDLDGRTINEMADAGQLNSPWGLAIAPENFGPFGRALLVANFGDGTIAAFDTTTGAFRDYLRDNSRPEARPNSRAIFNVLNTVNFTKPVGTLPQAMPTSSATEANRLRPG